MLVKFTNLNVNLLDMPVYINAHNVLSVYESKRNGPQGGLTTTIYGTNGQEWYVEESLNEVVTKLNGVMNAKREGCSCK
jgi:uncharacterized protein YlzI (FlbEa/FlbD family)